MTDILTDADIEAAYQATYAAIRPLTLGCPILEIDGAPEAFAEAIAEIVRERYDRRIEELEARVRLLEEEASEDGL